jgi:hypothetical protein
MQERAMRCERKDVMRWPWDPRAMGILLIFLAVAISLVMIGEVIPPLWWHRDHPVVRVLLAFLAGGHLEDLLQEMGRWL